MWILSNGSNTHKAVVTSDALGSCGCGAFLDDGKWFQISWQGFWSQVHLTVKELLPVVVACAVWGRTTQGNSIRIRCDNAAVVAILRSGTSKDKLAMHLMRCLAFFRAEFNLSLEAEHLPGRLNTAADALYGITSPTSCRCVPMHLGHQCWSLKNWYKHS